jgi:hypothetical protein
MPTIGQCRDWPIDPVRRSWTSSAAKAIASSFLLRSLVVGYRRNFKHWLSSLEVKRLTHRVRPANGIGRCALEADGQSTLRLIWAVKNIRCRHAF